MAYGKTKNYESYPNVDATYFEIRTKEGGPHFEVTKTIEGQLIKEEAHYLEGELIYIEKDSYIWKKKKVKTFKFYFKSDELYIWQGSYNNVSRSGMNQLLNVEKLGLINIQIYYNNKAGFPAITIRNNDEKIGWKYDSDYIKSMIDGDDYSKLDEFMENKLMELRERINSNIQNSKSDEQQNEEFEFNPDTNTGNIEDLQSQADSKNCQELERNENTDQQNEECYDGWIKNSSSDHTKPQEMAMSGKPKESLKITDEEKKVRIKFKKKMNGCKSNKDIKNLLAEFSITDDDIYKACQGKGYGDIIKSINDFLIEIETKDAMLKIIFD